MILVSAQPTESHWPGHEFLFFKEGFSNYSSQEFSALLNLNIMFRKDAECRSPGCTPGFRHFLVPWLGQVTQLTSPNLNYPVCKIEAALAFQTIVMRVK